MSVPLTVGVGGIVDSPERRVVSAEHAISRAAAPVGDHDDRHTAVIVHKGVSVPAGGRVPRVGKRDVRAGAWDAVYVMERAPSCALMRPHAHSSRAAPTGSVHVGVCVCRSVN